MLKQPAGQGFGTSPAYPARRISRGDMAWVWRSLEYGLNTGFVAQRRSACLPQRLKEIANLDPSSQVLSQFDYSYDSAGQITRWQQQQKTLHQNFALDYDAAGQLTAGRGALPPPFANQSFYSYDQAANRTAVQTAQVQNLLIGGSKTTADVLTINVFDAGLSGGSKAVSYTVLSGDSLTSITTALATAINNDTSLQGIGVTATSSGTKLTLTSVSTNATSYLPSKSSSVSETMLFGLPANGTVTASLGGTKTTGDTVTITVFDAGLTGGSVAKTYTVLAGDSLNSIATGVAAAINGDTNLANLGITAAAVTPTTSVSVVNITSTSNNATTYSQSSSGGATETIALSKNVGVSSASFNNVNELIGLAAGGNTRFQGTTDVPVKALTVLPGSSTFNITRQTPNTTAYAKSLSSGATETITLGTSGANETATIGGTKTTGDILTLTFTTTALGMGGSHSTSYQVVVGDTSLTDVATHFTAALNADTMLQSAGIAATSSGAVITISNLTTFTSSVSGSATETVTFGTGTDGSVTATIGGTKTTGDVVSIIAKDARLAGGQETASYTVVSSDNLTTIANGL